MTRNQRSSVIEYILSCVNCPFSQLIYDKDEMFNNTLGVQSCEEIPRFGKLDIRQRASASKCGNWWLSASAWVMKANGG